MTEGEKMYTSEKISPNKYKILIKIDAKEWEKYLQEAYEETKEKYSVQGFRKGKAPRKVIEQNYGNNIFFDTALDIGFSKEYNEALEKEKHIEPIDQPSIKIESFDENGVVINATVECMPEVVLGAYKGLKVEGSKETLDENRIEKELNQARQRQARFVPVEREAKIGDVVTIDFVGSVDEKVFKGGSAKDHRLELGSKSFIDNFEEQVVGMKVDEKKDVIVSFPKDYAASELADKKAKFEVTVKKIEEKQLPELNDKFASEVSEFDKLEDYKNDIKKHLIETLNEHIKKDNENRLIEAVVKNSQVEIPDVLTERQLDLFLQDFETRLSYQNVKLDDYLKWSNTTVEKLREEKREQAKEMVTTRLVLEELIKKEKLDVTDEELKVKLTDLASKYKKSLEDYTKSLGEKQINYFKNELLMDKVIDFLEKNNTII